MHHTQALKTLLQCLEELTTTVDTFGSEQKLHAVEKDLVLYRGRLLYESILKLPEADAALQPPVPPVQPVERPEVKPQPLKEEYAASPVAEDAEAEQPKVSEEKALVAEQPGETKAEVPAADEPWEEEKGVTAPMEQTPDLEIEQLVISVSTEEKADQPEEGPESKVTLQFERFSIAEVLKLSGDKDLILTHLKLKPIHDLKSGIGLNEKFLFIRELFANDHQAYADAVDALNSRANVEEAEAYIAGELLPRYGWEMEKEALVNFLHLVLRRFSKQ